MDNLLKELYKKLINFLFPVRCLGCGKLGEWFCEDCRYLLRSPGELTCLVCGRASIGGFTHPKCRTRNTPERVICFFDYEQKEVAEAVRLLKYKKHTSLAEVMAELIVECLKENGVEIGQEAIVIPVPLHPVKLLLRGFNQAGVLGESLAKKLGVGIRKDLVRRVKDTPSQTSLKKAKRRENVKDAFLISSGKEGLIQGKDFIVVDDVYTTGATILEVCKELKRAGARYVYALTFAH